MTSLSTNAADDASSVILLLRAVVLSMADLTTVLAGLILIVSECTIQGGEFTELVALELVLTFGDGSSLSLSVSLRRNLRQ